MPVSENEENTGGILSGYALTMSRDTGLLLESWDLCSSDRGRGTAEFAGCRIDAGQKILVQIHLAVLDRSSRSSRICCTGRALKPGTYAESTLNMMAMPCHWRLKRERVQRI